jgi:hypothetical protein
MEYDWSTTPDKGVGWLVAGKHGHLLVMGRVLTLSAYRAGEPKA